MIHVGIDSHRSHAGGASVQRGLTLIELLVVIIVVGVSFSVAVPSFRAMQDNNRLRATSSDLANALNLARSQAATMRINVTVQPIGPGWDNGWQVIYNWPAGTPANERIEDDLTITASGDVAINGPNNPVVFLAGGLVGGGQQTFLMCKSSAGRNIVVSPLGRVSIEKTAC
jgi:type IV fimbrial biogenesis protein FimT